MRYNNKTILNKVKRLKAKGLGYGSIAPLLPRTTSGKVMARNQVKRLYIKSLGVDNSK